MSAKVKFATCIGQAAGDGDKVRYCLNNVLVGPGVACASDARMAAMVTVDSEGLDEEGFMMIPPALIPKSKADLKAVWTTNGEDGAHVSRQKPNKPAETALAEDGPFPQMSDCVPAIDPLTKGVRVISLDANLLAKLAAAINPPDDADWPQGHVRLVIQPAWKGRDFAIGVVGNAKYDGLGVLMPLNDGEHGNAFDSKKAIEEYERRRKLLCPKVDGAIKAWATKDLKAAE